MQNYNSQTQADSSSSEFGHAFLSCKSRFQRRGKEKQLRIASQTHSNTNPREFGGCDFATPELIRYGGSAWLTSRLARGRSHKQLPRARVDPPNSLGFESERVPRAGFRGRDSWPFWPGLLAKRKLMGGRFLCIFISYYLCGRPGDLPKSNLKERIAGLHV